jgi:acyl-[acyl-carrier-protein]-phospholipid O-acyltransferase / long-chain-fatty-acid--[acyl-carrier-protein] ligase
MRDGWCTTGDIAFMDEDGFLTITDRLSRFSKIGGEMVPHIRIEEKLHELVDAAEQVFAVTSVADDRKGERLVVVHTLPESKLASVLQKFAQFDLPPLEAEGKTIRSRRCDSRTGNRKDGPARNQVPRGLAGRRGRGMK